MTDVAAGVLGLEERRRLRLFGRYDRLGRFVSCLVYIPRDRYTTEARLLIAQLLEDAFGAVEIDHVARVSESVLARLHFTLWLGVGAGHEPVDLPALEERLSHATRAWADDLLDALVARYGESGAAAFVATYGDAFPEAYKEDVPAAVAVDDIARLESGADHAISASLTASSSASA